MEPIPEPVEKRNVRREQPGADGEEQNPLKHG